MGVLSFTACSSDDDGGKNIRYMLPQTEKIHLTPREQAMVDQNNEFAFDLLRAVYKQQQSGANRNRSFCLSPVGVSAMLGMLANGASGDTRQEALDALKMKNAIVADVNNLFDKIIEEAPETDKQVCVKMANAIFAGNDMPLEKKFSDVVDEYYDAEAKNVDFAKPEALSQVNNWCKDETDGKISTMFDKLDPNATSYLLNSTYFKATWTHQFDKAQTKNESFTQEDGSVVQVPMMSTRARLLAYSTSLLPCTMECLPYGSGTSWCMYLVHPAKNQSYNATMESTISGLNNAVWDNLLQNDIDVLFDMKVPKFTTSNLMDMKEVLQAAGVKKMFSDEAELGFMCAREDAYISHVFQKSRIEVDEEGSKETAVNVGDVQDPEKPDTPPVLELELKVSEPFIYFVCEQSTGMIFLAGVYQGN